MIEKQFSDHRVALGVMCKAPRPGLAKTRLGAHVGPEAAALLAGAFLRDVAGTALALEREGVVAPFAIYKPLGSEAELRRYVGSDMPLVLQDDEDLGAAMFGALAAMLERCPAGALLIGSDLPTLPAEVIATAAGHLLRAGPRVVFGAADDGGFYLVGIKSLDVGSLFDPMTWGQPDVMATMRLRASRLGLKVAEVAKWYDVDDLVGLERLKSDLAQGEEACAPHTRAMLTAL